jgi:hypothetical protein
MRDFHSQTCLHQIKISNANSSRLKTSIISDLAVSFGRHCFDGTHFVLHPQTQSRLRVQRDHQKGWSLVDRELYMVHVRGPSATR